MKIAFAADHAGFDLKNAVKAHVERNGFEVLDLGAFNAEPSDYPDFAEAIGKAIQSKTAGRGVLICGSGVGASIAANKLRGIRAGLCHDSYSAHQGVEHDNMNILVLGSRVIGEALARDLVDQFLRASFSNEERHVRRLQKVQVLENWAHETH
jgi:RpiB/LacA/LacB family sugar-phosphate isomerase